MGGGDNATESKSAAIEKALFALMGQATSRRYNQQARRLVLNLSGKANRELRQRILSGALAPDALVRLSPKELAPKALALKREEWREKAKARVKFDPRDAGFAATDYACPECKGTQTIYRQKRRKLAVDRFQLFVRCLDCGHQWEPAFAP